MEKDQLKLASYDPGQRCFYLRGEFFCPITTRFNLTAGPVSHVIGPREAIIVHMIEQNKYRVGVEIENIISREIRIFSIIKKS